MRKYTALLLMILCFCSLSAQKQLFYLGENKEKIHFETVDTLSYVLFKTEVADVQKRMAIKNNRKAIPLKGRSMFLNINSEDDIVQLRSDGNVESAYRVMRSQNGDLHVLTDDILVKLNPGEDRVCVRSVEYSIYLREADRRVGRCFFSSTSIFRQCIGYCK